MGKSYIDPETGLKVTVEHVGKNKDGNEEIDESITDVETGQTYRRRREVNSPASSIAEWVYYFVERPKLRKLPKPGKTETLHALFPEMANGSDVPNPPLGEIKLIFAESFLPWEIILPNDAVAQRERGKICQSGWAIWFLFDSDEKGEYLDYYSAHRMTNDGHVRIYEDGQTEYLKAIPDFRISSKDPVEDARLEKEFIEESRQINKMLEAKGFGMTGNEPGGVQIRRYQQLEDPK